MRKKKRHVGSKRTHGRSGLSFRVLLMSLPIKGVVIFAKSFQKIISPRRGLYKIMIFSVGSFVIPLHPTADPTAKCIDLTVNYHSSDCNAADCNCYQKHVFLNAHRNFTPFVIFAKKRRTEVLLYQRLV